jgi:ParB family chromosome partitioning protein
MQGIDLLFGSNGGETEKNVQMVPPSEIDLSLRQPRRYFDPKKQESLIESIREHGILQPMIVRPKDERKLKYQLVAGERRYRAAIFLALELVPVIVRNLSDEEAFLFALLENLQREDLNPVEETEAIMEILQSQLSLSADDVVAILNSAANRDRESVNNVIHTEQWRKVESIFSSLGRFTPNSFRVNRLPLLKLPEEILMALREGKIEYTKAKAIAKLKDEEARGELLEEAIAQNLSLTQIRARVNELMAKVQEDSSPIQITPQREMTDIYQRLKKSELWKKEPQKWKKVQGWLKKIESLLEEESVHVESGSGGDPQPLDSSDS